jgi:hypothetical protein
VREPGRVDDIAVTDKVGDRFFKRNKFGHVLPFL